MHVAVAIPDLGGGGAERTTLGIASGLIAKGHRVDVLVFGNTIAEGYGLPAGVRLITLKGERGEGLRERLEFGRKFGWPVPLYLSRRMMGWSQSVATYMRQERPDCVLASLSMATIAVLLGSSQILPSPIVVPLMHNNVLKRSWKYRSLYTRLFPVADRVVAVSEGVARSVIEELHVSEEKVERIYNPVVTAEMDRLVEEVPVHPWFGDQGPPIVLAAGRLSRVKDFPTLLRAFRLVLRSRPARLVVLGEGRWRERLVRLARALGIDEEVSLAGWVANPFAFMGRASVFVLSSRFEGFGNVLVEAMACGCPCVSTDCPYGPSEILEEGRFGRLVAVGDAVGLAEAIESVLDNPPPKKILQARAKEFSFDRSVDEYNELILKLIGERERRWLGK